MPACAFRLGLYIEKLCRINVMSMSDDDYVKHYLGFLCESLRLQLTRELLELIEIHTWRELEGMRNRLRRGVASDRGGLTDLSANCSSQRFPKRNAELARACHFKSPARSSSRGRVVRIRPH